MAAPYDPDVYRRFAENLRGALDGPNIERLSMRALRRKALETAVITANGSPLWFSSISSRIAAKTVYLGNGPEIVLPRPSPEQLAIVEKAPEQLHKVLQLMRTMPFVHVRRQMGDNREFNPVCNLYVCVADRKNYRLAYEWAMTMGDVKRSRPGPEFIMIDVPQEHQLRMQVLTIPEHDINIALGTDYTGECKKGFLRQGMFRADGRGMLGLHAGTKLVRARDAASGKLKTYAVFMFGLTATGKSTWSCHQLGLDSGAGEGTWVSQDDIVFLRRDGSSYGTELGFYVKTDVNVNLQEAMYNSLVHHSALLENVMVDAKGQIDFLDERLGENGRGVLDRRELKVRRGRKMESICADTINTANLEEVDGIVFAFITRRGTIMPFAQRLTPEQGVMAYLWGESTHSFATVPAKAGESVRIVGMDDFIIGAQGRKVNAFHDIVMDLVARYPGKVHFFQYNTGGVGEIIEIDKATGKKKQVRKVTRVPIDLMAALQRGDLRGTNEYAKGRLGTEYVVTSEGTDLAAYDARNFYSDEQVEAYVADLVDGRRKFTEEIAAQGLRKDIREIAHRELDAIDAKGRKRAEPWAPAEAAEQTAAEDRDPRSKWISPWEPRRPSGGLFPQPAGKRR
ncbi:MAG: phosphoenolpyruvate carboxykinase (ATP) [Thermoanaerobaculaceae bacterium]|nr:phosphoenolpyruvate carboxykinase (ATP) [Thermoanaerobaculaceae bacterium]TAM48286.1 MAG: phosphoenolpyruvate carboxykinase (ATP) [Acidobacteriota bacterium]